MQELVSVILPTYNRKHTIVRAIESVLNQTWQNIELIIVDDASTDGTFDMVAELYGEDKRITYIINDANMGPAGARNAGADVAKGDWIAFQDSDDEWHPDKLEKQMSLATEHACGGGCIRRLYVIIEMGKWRSGHRNLYQWNINPGRYISWFCCLPCVLHRLCCFPESVLWRQEVS